MPRRLLLLAAVLSVLAGLFFGCTLDFNQFEPLGFGGAGGNAVAGPATTTGPTTGSTTGPTTTGATTTGTGMGGAGGAPQCTNAGQCNDSNPCTTDACTGGMCTHLAVADGLTPGVTQMTGTCQQEVCAAGVDKMVPDDMNAPTSNLPCIVDSCMNGKVVQTNDPQGMACGAMGKCNATGQCMGCNLPSDCGTSTFCLTQTCTSGVCGTLSTAQGTVLPNAQQTPGNCQELECDGKGNTMSVVHDANTPASPSTCVLGVCTGGVPSTLPVTAGMPGPGCANMVCDGSGNCVQCVTDAQCMAPQTCGGAGMTKTCGCTSVSMATTCMGKCDLVFDNCHQQVECGACGTGFTCMANDCVSSADGGTDAGDAGSDASDDAGGDGG